MYVREPVVAGAFYPADPTLLRNTVKGFLKPSADVNRGEVVAILSPHAGYQYSGGVAGHAYSTLAGRNFDTVVILSPSHREVFRIVCVFDGDAYQTPLGDLQVDKEFAQTLVEQEPWIKFGPLGHTAGRTGEHSIEVQLPFLQVAIDGPFQIVPVVMGDQDVETSRRLGESLALAARATTRRTLFVASSDLSHFHADDQARTLDAGIVEAVKALDVDRLWLAESAGSEGCGLGPLAAVMRAAELMGANRVTAIDYATSGDVPHGSRDSVVGYLAAAFIREAEQ